MDVKMNSDTSASGAAAERASASQGDKKAPKTDKAAKMSASNKKQKIDKSNIKSPRVPHTGVVQSAKEKRASAASSKKVAAAALEAKAKTSEKTDSEANS
jgi:hypothetical protein